MVAKSHGEECYQCGKSVAMCTENYRQIHTTFLEDSISWGNRGIDADENLGSTWDLCVACAVSHFSCGPGAKIPIYGHHVAQVMTLNMGEGRAEASARSTTARMSTAFSSLHDYRSEGVSAQSRTTRAWVTKVVSTVAARINLRLSRSIWIHCMYPGGKRCILS